MNTNDTYKRARRILDAGCMDDAILTFGYAEPGYGTGDDDIVAIGNWNDRTRWDRESRRAVVVDNTPSRVAKLLEKLGVSLEWEDEWTLCADCYRAVRTQADSYSWTRSYTDTDDGPVCEDCTLKDPAGYLASLEGNHRTAITLAVNPEHHGYKLLADDFQNGLYGGQSADPARIAKHLESCGIYRYIFRIDSVGQFDLSFSVFVHEDEMDLAPSDLDSDGPDPAVMMKRALENIPPAPAGEGIAYTKVDIATGIATTRRVSPEEFIEGIRD